jgi:membrane-bound lytic murein transglycosylase A
MARRALLLLLFLFLIVGCAPRIQRPAPPVVMPTPPVAVVPPTTTKPPETPGAARPSLSLVRLPADQIPLFADDMDLATLDAALQKSLDFYSRTAGEGGRLMGDRVVTLQDLRESIAALRAILQLNENEQLRQAKIRESFDVYRSTGLDGKNTVTFTGYFEPIMNGSVTKTERYKYPIYRAPDDAVIVYLRKFGERYPYDQLVGRVQNAELVPYYRRAEIDELGFLAGRNLEIVWVDDRIELFFLHIQGSGKIKLSNGNILQIGYALKNGRPFRSVTTYLLEKKRITPEERSYRAVKKYLRDHPEELSEVLSYNESYVFFRELERGPVGSLGEILTPGRSIATDAAVFPRGAPAFIRTRKPVFDREGNIISWIPLTRFVVSQDAGGAIKGAGRVDLFCGTGEEAELLAGSLAERGELYFLVKKLPNNPTAAGDVRP